MTLVKQTVDNLRPLILRLKNKPGKDVDAMNVSEKNEYFEQKIKELREMLDENIDKYQQLILSARPSPDDPNFERKKEAYNELLKMATTTMDKLQGRIGDVLTDYDRFIDELWNAISNDQDPTAIQREFEEKINKFMVRSVHPAFEAANNTIEKIHQS
jgi:hypothetical protein